MPAPQPIQPIYYTAAQPLYAMDTSGSSTPSTTSPAGTPSPVQYVHVLPSPSRSGSPLPFVQIINGQPMLVQPLASHIQSVVQSPPPSVAVLQPMPEPLTVMSAPQPIHVHPPSQPASSITTVLDSSGMESSRSEEVPPAVPPKPQASAPVPTPTQQVYVPTRISHSIATQMNAAPSLVQRPGNNPPPDVAQIHSDMPGTFPVTANSTTLPLHIQPQQQQPRRLSWDDTAFAPPSSANGRRAISGSQDRSASSVILNMPPLTGIGSSPYPPLTPTAMDNGRNGNGRDGYFPPYHNGHSHRDSHPPDRDVRPEIRRPQRAHSHAHSARTPRDGYPLDLSRRGTYPMMANSNGQGIINLDDRPGDIERGEHVPSRRNSAYSNQDGRAAGAGARRSNVDLNRAPVENGGLRRSSTGTSENTRTSVNGGGGVLGLMGWLRGRPQLKKETSELVDELSAVVRCCCCFSSFLLC
ncbi:hypothetical protein BDY19DRAFT_455478 [Irpex rosettiformis]|uniref:Uncharacterized protein n=1 Tax=Irpex rosettiformis TaxID=378272 RepID=A0ACB8TT68_9APHY|nr:hypothetical protein BDY19DRAFT_455478 [Irpex rosettiformis]